MAIDPKISITILSAIKNEILGVFKGIKDEAQNTFAIGLAKYIADRQQKFSKINTFIFRHEKVAFYDTYYRLSLSRKQKSKKIICNSDDILNHLFIESNTAGIIGIAGSGKTMLTKHVFLKCKNETFKIPIFIELRDLNNYSKSLIEYVYEIILSNKIKPSTRILERALKSGNFLFIFDGFDELNLDKKDQFTSDIEKFIDTFHNNNFLFSSRPGTSIESFSRLTVFSVEPLQNEEIKNFVKIQAKLGDDTELGKKIIKTITESGDNGYKAYVSNPLLLSMFILTFGNYPELPKYKNKFYWNVFDTLCNRHDSLKKGGYRHDKKTKFQDTDFESIIKAFCIKSVLENQFNFDRQYLITTLTFVTKKLNLNCNIDDLVYDFTVALSILIQDGLTYKFPHRTLQDYFAVSFICDQNDESKQKFYKEKILVLLEDVNSNTNIFDLFKEMDQDSYYSYFLIPIIEEFNKKYHQTNSYDKAILFLKDINFYFSYTRSRGGSNRITSVGTRGDNLPILKILTLVYQPFFMLFHSRTNEFFSPKSELFSFLNKLPVVTQDSDEVLYINNLNKTQLKNLDRMLKMKEQAFQIFDVLKKAEIQFKKSVESQKRNKQSIWDI